MLYTTCPIATVNNDNCTFSKEKNTNKLTPIINHGTMNGKKTNPTNAELFLKDINENAAGVPTKIDITVEMLATYMLFMIAWKNDVSLKSSRYHLTVKFFRGKVK